MNKNRIKKIFKTHKKTYFLMKEGYKIVSSLQIYAFRIISLIFTLFPLEKNKIVIVNYFGKGYGDNGKYIVEELLKSNLTLDLVWLVQKTASESEFPKGVRLVRYNSIKSIFELSTANIWIDNCRKSYIPIKRKKQKYIQTWHGCIGFKKVEADAVETLSKQYIKSAKLDSKNADYFISNSKWCTEKYRNSFWYEGEILEIGTPRNDVFFVESYNKAEVYQKLGIPKHKKMLLYAPTFRNSGSVNVYKFNYYEILKALNNRFRDEWVVVLRLHPNISGLQQDLNYDKDIINGTKVDDMQVLLNSCDMLITDYSSSAFDVIIKDTPVILYIPDYDDYNIERGVNFPIDKIGFPTAKTEDEICSVIHNFDQDNYLTHIQSLKQNFGYLDDGLASSRIRELIEDIINSKESN